MDAGALTWLAGRSITSVGGDPGSESDLQAVVGQGLTARDWITAGVVLVAFVLLGRIVRIVVERLVRKTDTEGQIAPLVSRIAQNLVRLIGVVYALNVLEVQIGPLLGALGISGIAIAFALTAILENVFASVVLKTRKPIRLGDQISTKDHSGTLEEINFRTVVLRNFDGEKVVLPSAMVNNNVVVNHTDLGIRRTVLPVGVAYGTDLRRAQRTILDAVTGVEGVAATPEPQAWVTAFGNSSIDFDVRYWHRSDIATFFRVRSDVAMAIKAAFDADGIEIPFPQRVVTMVDPDRQPGRDGGGATSVADGD